MRKINLKKKVESKKRRKRKRKKETIKQNQRNNNKRLKIRETIYSEINNHRVRKSKLPNLK